MIPEPVIIHRSPDVTDWPETLRITALEMQNPGGLVLHFDRPPPESWKWPSNPNVPSENYQYTVWAVVEIAGRWHAAGFVQMWQGREMGNGSLPPILSQYVNWWGDVRHLWGEMSDYVPRAGDHVGFLVSAGNARLTDGVSSVAERSNVVDVELPPNDVGSFTFSDAPPPEPPAGSEPEPPREPVPPPPPDILLAILTDLQRRLVHVEQLAAEPAPTYRGSLLGIPITLTPERQS